MDHHIYDVVVVGAGIEGSATAHYLAKRGTNTLLLEQFPLPHSRGSSHGQSRITRKAYEETFYTEMMLEATDMWLELQKNFGSEIFIQSGMLTLGESSGKYFKGVVEGLSSTNSGYRVLSPSDVKTHYPMLKYPDSFSGVLDFDGGILRADKILQAFQSEFTKHGGVLKDGFKVKSITPGSVVSVETATVTFRGRNVIVTAGPWALSILKPLGLNLPLTPIQLKVFYWKERESGSHSISKLPPFYVDDPNAYVYGLPSAEYPGHVKICLSTGPETDPDDRDRADSSWVLRFMTKYVQQHFPGLVSSAPSLEETCIRTSTPDSHPIIDRHPRWRNIIIGVGFSGHGFKLSPVVGKLLGQLALEEPPSYDVTHFRIGRFQSASRL